MNRAERRRQQKKAKKEAGKGKLGKTTIPVPTQQTQILQQSINLALQHHAAGRLSEAESIYQQILQTNPNQPEALHLLGLVAHQGGKNEIAVDLINKAIAIKPNYAEAYNDLGNTLKELGRSDEAVASFHKALAIKPDYAVAHSNLGTALQHLGKLDEAVHTLQTAIERDTCNPLLNSTLINILNYHVPHTKPHVHHAKAQIQYQSVRLKDCDASPITDESVQLLYRRCMDIANVHNVSFDVSSTQIYRGVKYDPGCKRHKKVFDTFNVIPAFCFGCYKIAIDVHTVVDLFKLLVLFDVLDLPHDNTRKCLVEVRPDISGTYKGLIYCKSLVEAKKLAKPVQSIVDDKISNGASTSIKRGCSEFPLSYPEFGRVDEDKGPLMTYNEDWRQYEESIDRDWLFSKSQPGITNHNHSSVTLRDAAIMKNWLAYAAAIGDESYMDISGGPVSNLLIQKRAPFQTK